MLYGQLTFMGTANEFNKLRNNLFPNVIGCGDGSHIPIKGPTDDNTFYNIKGFHSMIVQRICNAKLEFITNKNSSTDAFAVPKWSMSKLLKF